MPVEFCGCTAAAEISAKSGVAKQSDKPKMQQSPVHINDGANFQDAKYGKGMRVHNEMKRTPTNPNSRRCTVCGKVKG